MVIGIRTNPRILGSPRQSLPGVEKFGTASVQAGLSSSIASEIFYSYERPFRIHVLLAHVLQEGIARAGAGDLPLVTSRAPLHFKPCVTLVVSRYACPGRSASQGMTEKQLMRVALEVLGAIVNGREPRREAVAILRANTAFDANEDLDAIARHIIERAIRKRREQAGKPHL
jgi:hypothetical protein